MKLLKSLKRLVFTGLVKQHCAEFGEGLCVNHLTRVTKQTYIGKFCNFNGMTVNGNGRVDIGSYFHSGEDCYIISQNHNFEGTAIPYDNTYISKPVRIEDFVWMGTRVMVLPGVTIGEGAIIQGGAVVVKDVPAMAIAGGNPAQVFKYRNEEHFRKLKEAKKFN